MEASTGIKFQYASASFSLGMGLKSPGPAQNANAAPSPLGSSLALRLFVNQAAAASGSQAQAAAAQVSQIFTGVAPISLMQDASATETGSMQTESTPQAVVSAAPKEIAVARAPPALPASEFIEIGADQQASRAASKLAREEEAAGKALNEADIIAAGRTPYWMRTCKNIKSPFLRLHQEMVELTELLHPTQAEYDSRNEAVEAVTQAVNSIWPEASVAVFGSFATGLFVPTSDVDVVILDSNCTDIQSGLKALAAALMRKSVAQNVQVIGRARVPIIKFETQGFGRLAFDVSFDVANGPEAAELVKEFVGQWPMMRSLVLVLKLFLQQRDLNEVYSGGIGSYALITMVCAFLQLHNSRRLKKSDTSKSKADLLEPSLGVLLVDFFRFFGRVVNMPQVGMAASSGGRFFRKGDVEHRDWVNQERPHMLAVEDPKDPSNDICRSSFNIMRVKSAFDFAYQQLTAPSLPNESMLARILRLGAILVSRNPPSNPRKIYLLAGPPGGGGAGG
eukprot:CAMPEP_0119102870 /NCGR_PEP_ID=MMETSP1180-20130426/1473_1 /TAXON_ID=3052 ORGANISM="Chlamydomonas cf sp, Strain CCMP681" /NCGR_SAMPLE_ID=MMETSP1180 /ASSEMBLY_ACC=CAM_ASM_000741 /LENGTH=507 /DNA_ID=CAMNT_0007087247 /DNA_START=36 /DNA_END=1556 /DNA_ORIENTATION=-